MFSKPSGRGWWPRGQNRGRCPAGRGPRPLREDLPLFRAGRPPRSPGRTQPAALPLLRPPGKASSPAGQGGVPSRMTAFPRDGERAGTPQVGAEAPRWLPSGVRPEVSLGSGEPENVHAQRPRQSAELHGWPGLAGAPRLHLGQRFPNPPHGRPREPVSLGQARPGLPASGRSERHTWKTLPKHGSGQVRACDVWTLHRPVTFLSPPAPHPMLSMRRS